MRPGRRRDPIAGGGLAGLGTAGPAVRSAMRPGRRRAPITAGGPSGATAAGAAAPDGWRDRITPAGAMVRPDGQPDCRAAGWPLPERRYGARRGMAGAWLPHGVGPVWRVRLPGARRAPWCRGQGRIPGWPGRRAPGRWPRRWQGRAHCLRSRRLAGSRSSGRCPRRCRDRRSRPRDRVSARCHAVRCRGGTGRTPGRRPRQPCPDRCPRPRAPHRHGPGQVAPPWAWSPGCARGRCRAGWPAPAGCGPRPRPRPVTPGPPPAPAWPVTPPWHRRRHPAPVPPDPFR